MILVCGETIVDMLPDPGPDGSADRFTAYPGGSPANTAVALARLGSDAGLCARLSRSSLGRLLRTYLEENRVDLAYALDVEEPASVAFVALDSSGVPSYSFYAEGTADWQWTPEELPAELPREVRALHTGSIAAARPPGCAALAQLFAREHDRRMCSVDLNCRPPLIGPPDVSRAWLEGLIGTVHLVKASEEDLAWLYPGEPIDLVVGRWQAIGAALAVVTRGGEGAVGYVGGERLQLPARPVEVADTVGAGDAYSAGLLHWLEREEVHPEQVRSGHLPLATLGAALEFAGAVAALACSRAGADPPTGDEVAAMLATGEGLATGESSVQAGRTR